LTAHPTEVRRKSTLDREMEIADLLDRRDRVQLTHDEMAASNERLPQAVLTLRKTSMLRRNRLTVAAPIPASWARSIAWAMVPVRGAAPANVCARVLRM